MRYMRSGRFFFPSSLCYSFYFVFSIIFFFLLSLFIEQFYFFVNATVRTNAFAFAKRTNTYLNIVVTPSANSYLPFREADRNNICKVLCIRTRIPSIFWISPIYIYLERTIIHKSSMRGEHTGLVE